MERRKMRLYRTPVLGSLAPRTVVAYTHLHTHLHTHVHIYIYIYVCVCVCCIYLRLAGTRRLSRRSGGSALRAVTASAGNGQEKYGGDQMVAALQ
jgi:hypothetical protein